MGCPKFAPLTDNFDDLAEGVSEAQQGVTRAIEAAERQFAGVNIRSLEIQVVIRQLSEIKAHLQGVEDILNEVEATA